MRLAFALLLVGCVQREDPGPWVDPGPQPSYGCESDSECSTGNVCARDGDCVPAAEITSVHVTWTLKGQPASVQTCANSPNLEVHFSSGTTNGFGFSPVPCVQGVFTVDKLPNWYIRVSVFRDGTDYGGAVTYIDKGTAAVDLAY